MLSVPQPPAGDALAIERAIGVLCLAALAERGQIPPGAVVLDVALTFRWSALLDGQVTLRDSTWRVSLTGGAR